MAFIDKYRKQSDCVMNKNKLPATNNIEPFLNTHS